MKAMIGATLMSDHERKIVAARAQYFHVLDGTVELQGHSHVYRWPARGRDGPLTCRADSERIVGLFRQSPQGLSWFSRADTLRDLFLLPVGLVTADQADEFLRMHFIAVHSALLHHRPAICGGRLALPVET